MMARNGSRTRVKPVELEYYCFLLPMTLPILFVAVYLHWLSMKLFKHA
ncbi:hypothetical protein Leryth_018445 [Lithospermum erythrorhizon]|nr:hypothetical protein Leryth_018445 [Lithospermum erythrorhizon]